MMTSEETLEDLRTEVSIEDGRLEMTAGGDADVRIHTADLTPLSKGEVLASIRVHGDDYRASIGLDGDDVEALGAILDELRGED